MISPHLAEQVASLLPSLKNTGQRFVSLGPCPFHSGNPSFLVVDYSTDSASCMTCNYGESIQTLVEDIKALPSETTAPSAKESSIEFAPPGIGTRYGYLLTEEVSQSIHKHLFAKKIKELNAAAKQLAQLVALMKLWIDPA
ncbi:MAG: hypothetical protein G3M70_00620 [Candidatus Nitronauta litoralis]|uniref:Zinc finger CHC2-type domain-containing protein n=1 Tax=Candidatus Nitronauta litoralis TaxID=2705533 RepID=A0A7T0FYG0_9BACT|nr:MAG: hypothetical protein G3M70_00620 [Candidatus Nitronauta litoralis]